MTDDDFQIELGESVRRHIERKDRPDSSRHFFAAPFDSPQDEKTPVFIADKVMRAMEQHAAGRIECEVGGVLLGGFFQSDKGPFIEITDLIEATAAEGTDVSLTFTHDTWAQIHSELAQRPAGTRIVGWYHSHPGLGVFLSSQDEFIHTSFFADPWHVAIVVDPIYHNWGCFSWENDALDQADGFYVFDDKKNAKTVKDYVANLNMARQATPASASAAADRGTRAQTAPLWVAIALLVIIQIVTAVAAFRSKPEPDYMKLADQSLRHSDLTGAERFLRMELARGPERASPEALRRLEQLDKVGTDSQISKLDNTRLDAINFSLMVADQMKANNSASSSADLLQTTAQVYSWSAPTLGDRSRRAERITFVLRRTDEFGKMDAGEIRKTWFGAAEEWLKEEANRRRKLGMDDSGQKAAD